MRPLPLSEIARMIGGHLHDADSHARVANARDADEHAAEENAVEERANGERVIVVDAVVSDTRTMPKAGAPLFLALKGERFDGHDHVAAAAQAGAVAALVSHPIEASIPQVLVDDTEQALARLAAALQRGRNSEVLAITGSNGKTSVKTLLLSILERCGKTYVNPGNRNNEIGLPLAVIDAPDDAEFAVYEMGAGKPDDIAYLTAIVPPHIALVNNIAPAHLERMGSLLGVADTKAAIYDALPADGVAVINADDAFAGYFADRACGRQLLRFGIDASADVRARAIRTVHAGMEFVLVAPDGEAAIALPWPGRHNVSNALAAAALALAAGVPFDAVIAGLTLAKPVPGRLEQHMLPNGVMLIDDSYNANPSSLAVAIDLLAAEQGEAWLVLGDMGELGADAQDLHAEAGRRAQMAGIARLYALGNLSAQAAQAFGEGARWYDSHAALAEALRNDLSAVAGAAHGHDGDESRPWTAPARVRVLVKGSRSSAMERVVRALLNGEAQHAA